MIQLAATFEAPAPAAAIPAAKGFAPATAPAAQGFARALKNAAGNGEASPEKGNAAAGKDAGKDGRGLVTVKASQQPAAAVKAQQANAQQGTAGSAASQGEAAADAAIPGANAGVVDGKILEAELTAAGSAGQDEETAAEAAAGSMEAETEGNNKVTTAVTAATTAAAMKNRGDGKELKRRSLAAEAQQPEAAVATLPGEANAAKAAEKMAAQNTPEKCRGAERKEEQSEAGSHAADAAKSAANPLAAIFTVTAATTRKAGEVNGASAATTAPAGGAIEAAEFLAQPQNPAGVQGVTAAVEDDTAEQLAMVTPEMTAGKGTSQNGAQVMQQPVHSAFERASFYTAGPAAPGATVKPQQGANAQVAGQVADAGVPQSLQAATPQEQPAKGAEGAQQQSVVTETTDRQAAGQQLQQVQVKAEQTENLARQGKNEPHTVEGRHRLHAAEKGAVEQEGAAVKAASEGPSGATGAPAAQSVKFTTLQGIPGQNGSGDAGHNGHPGQNAQGNEHLQAAMMGMQTPAAEAPQPEAKGATLNSALHESILAQVKDGVVTRHADGNSQISIRLNPGELGELKIHVRMDDNRLKVEVQADNRGVKDLLMSNLDALKEALSAKNFTMEGFDVSSGGGGFNSPLNEQKGNPQQAAPRFSKGGGYGAPVERQVKYVTADANSLLDVRF